MHLKRKHQTPQILIFLSPTRETRWSSQFLALVWPKSTIVTIWGVNQQIHQQIDLCLSVPVILVVLTNKLLLKCWLCSSSFSPAPGKLLSPHTYTGHSTTTVVSQDQQHQYQRDLLEIRVLGHQHIWGWSRTSETQRPTETHTLSSVNAPMFEMPMTFMK